MSAKRKIPVKDGREFFAASFLWERSEGIFRMYMVLAGVFFAAFFFMEFITGDLKEPRAGTFLLNSIFLFLGIYVLAGAYEVRKQSDTDRFTAHFIEKFGGKWGKRTKVVLSAYLIGDDTDADEDYLFIKLNIPSLTTSLVDVFIRGDIVMDIAPFTTPDMWDKSREDARKLGPKLRLKIETSEGGRKMAYQFAEALLRHHPEDFVRAFVDKPRYTMRYFCYVSGTRREMTREEWEELHSHDRKSS